MTPRMHQHSETLGTGGIGLLASLGSFAVSLAEIEMSLRIASLVVGITVGLFTLRRLWKDNPKD